MSALGREPNAQEVDEQYRHLVEFMSRKLAEMSGVGYTELSYRQLRDIRDALHRLRNGRQFASQIGVFLDVRDEISESCSISEREMSSVSWREREPHLWRSLAGRVSDELVRKLVEAKAHRFVRIARITREHPLSTGDQVMTVRAEIADIAASNPDVVRVIDHFPWQ